MKHLSHLMEAVSTIFLATVVCIAQNVELHIEKLFKLQSHLCALQFVQRVGVVNAMKGRFARKKMQRLRDEWRQCFGQTALRKPCDERLGELLYGPTCDAPVLHSLRGYIIRLHAHLVELQGGCLLHFGMCKLKTAAIDRRFAENNVFNA